MKTRTGFVSNSSTSSFCIYGAEVTFEGSGIDKMKTFKKRFPEKYGNLFHDMLKGTRDDKALIMALRDIDTFVEQPPKMVRTCSHKINVENKFCSECGKEVWKEEIAIDMGALEDYASDLFSEFLYEGDFGLDYYNDGYAAYLGKSYASAPDDITFGAFRRDVEKTVSELVGKEVKCCHIEEEISN